MNYVDEPTYPFTNYRAEFFYDLDWGRFSFIKSARPS